MQPNQQPSLDEAIDKMRTEIIVGGSKFQQSALNGFDVLVNQLKNYNKIAIDLKKEIIRLEELCVKNKIEYKKNPQTPPAKKL
jgi:hypothetical protein